MLVLVLVLGAWCLGAVTIRVDAQTKKPQPAARPFIERGFGSFTGGLQGAPGELSEQVVFEANAEAGRFAAGYGGTAGVLVDGTIGFRVRRQLGIAAGVSRMTRSGTASVSAEIPHPFFDNRHRTVQGEAADISRTETAVHLQLYYDLRPRGPWRIRLSAGPSYFDIEQELIAEVTPIESFPFDTAEFGTVRTNRADGSGIGVSGGIEIARMFSRRVGAGALIRYAGAQLELHGPDSRRVSTDAGGFQGGLGMKVLF